MSTRFAVRKATIDDAEQIVAHMKSLEGDLGLLTEPGEFNFTIAAEREYLKSCIETPTSIFLVAEQSDLIIGMLQLRGNERSATDHVVNLGMSVAEKYRGAGVGSKLLAHSINWAKNTGVIQRIELHVFARNFTAIGLYQKFGFVTKGRHFNAAVKNKEFVNSLTMALLFHS